MHARRPLVGCQWGSLEAVVLSFSDKRMRLQGHSRGGSLASVRSRWPGAWQCMCVCIALPLQLIQSPLVHNHLQLLPEHTHRSNGCVLMLTNPHKRDSHPHAGACYFHARCYPPRHRAPRRDRGALCLLAARHKAKAAAYAPHSTIHHQFPERSCRPRLLHYSRLVRYTWAAGHRGSVHTNRVSHACTPNLLRAVQRSSLMP